MRQTATPTRSPRRGLTLVECMVALAITAVLAGLAAPSWQQAQARRHLDGAAAQLETDIQLARSWVVARNLPLRIGFESGATASCYVIHTGPAGACGCGVQTAAQCGAGHEGLRTVRLDAGAVRLQSNVASMLFDPLRGTSTPAGTIRFTAPDGRAVHQVVNIMGRVRSCSPNGVHGYRPC